MASPNSDPCLVCVSSKKSWDHLCLRHALCLDNNGLWDPSRCADCLSHFDSRLSVDDCGEYGRRSLIQVAKKIKKALKRAAGFGERNHIFVSDAIAQQFRADFLVDASYFKPSDQCGRDSISSRSSSVESLAGPRALGDLFRSGLPRSPSSHDFDDVVDLEGLEDNGSNLNPIMHSDPLVGQGALSVPIQDL